MIANHITHLYPPVLGGVSDYVDVCRRHDPQSDQCFLDKKSAVTTSLAGHYLLHYSGYGYAKRGAPLWLLNKIQQDRPHIKTLGIFFHELYASGPPWRSSFWLSPVQRHIARRLAEIADYWLTSREGSAQWLCQFTNNKPHAVLPIFSTVGEMTYYSTSRANRVVVFGGAALRQATYRAAGEALFSWIQAQGMMLHDIGPPIHDLALSTALERTGAMAHGRLEPEEVSKLLAEAAFGMVTYPANYVAKSSVFAAYCAHGVCPILISKHYAPSDGLVAGQHYWASLPTKVQQDRFEEIGRAAWEWYQLHRVASHVSVQKSIFKGI